VLRNGRPAPALVLDGLRTDSVDLLVCAPVAPGIGERCRLWGIYPVLNPLFMKKRVKLGLNYIVGAFWGVINTHEPGMEVSLDDKEDFERTLKFYMADGNVVRLEAYSLKTSYYSTPGGMQDSPRHF
jgi:hypothetical protein